MRLTEAAVEELRGLRQDLADLEVKARIAEARAARAEEQVAALAERVEMLESEAATERKCMCELAERLVPKPCEHPSVFEQMWDEARGDDGNTARLNAETVAEEERGSVTWTQPAEPSGGFWETPVGTLGCSMRKIIARHGDALDRLAAR